jgi:hypothetical protein
LYNLIQKVAWLFAIVFGAVGVLGFVPGLTTEGHLLHLLSGAAAAFAASQSKEYSVWYFKIFGAVYALVTIIGFVQGTTVLGLIGVNMADNVLHLAIAAAALGLGFCPCGACPMCKIRTSDQPTA